jgi:hypothetical protein
MTIEVDQDKFRGTCQNYRHGLSSDYTCRVVRPENGPLKVCSNCTTWSITDVIYEDLYKVRIAQTYDWWRSEFIRTGHSYAKDRMTDLYAEPVTTVAVKEPMQVPVKRQPPSYLSVEDSVRVILLFIIIVALFVGVFVAVL